jgi:hypothetical protein
MHNIAASHSQPPALLVKILVKIFPMRGTQFYILALDYIADLRLQQTACSPFKEMVSGKMLILPPFLPADSHSEAAGSYITRYRKSLGRR